MNSTNGTPISSNTLRPGEITIRLIGRSDIAQIAHLHSHSFPSFFLTSLGEPSLRELYAAIAAEPSAIGILAERGREIVGLAAGTMRPGGFYRRIMARRWWRFAVAAFPCYVRRPSLLWRIAWRLRGAEAEHHAGESELLSLAVLPSVRRSGIGQQLVESFVAIAKERGARAVTLTTDAADNDATLSFYDRAGFRRRRTFTTPEGRVIHEYVATLG